MRGNRSIPQMLMGVAILVALIFAVLIDNSDLRVALFGLLGTLTGALATFEATHVVSRRERQVMVRAAGRLLQEDLVFARMRVRHAEQNKRFWSPRFDLRLDGWERYRETVAKELEEPGDWKNVAGAFEAMRALQSKCTSLRTAFGDRPELGPLSREAMDLYLQRSESAINALARLSRDRQQDEVLIEDEAP